MHLFWKYKIDHLLFWTATVLFYAVVNSNLMASAGGVYYLLDILTRNGLLALICYVNIYYLFPAFFKPARYPAYFLGILASLFAYTLLRNGFDLYLHGYVLGNPDKQKFFANSFYNFSIAIFYLIFSLTLDLSRKWYRQQLQLQQIEMEKLTTELNYLKAQMNPHFLFNSINSIFFQIDKSNHKARESLQIFSDMLRYQLYECSADLIPIEKEISYIESYVGLQRLRREPTDLISFDVARAGIEFQIPPLLIIPFVENAFKHGSSTNGRLGFIHISLLLEDNCMVLDVQNSIHADVGLKQPGGIGLKNVKRRLELLYQDKHELLIEKKEDSFLVHLKIRL